MSPCKILSCCLIVTSSLATSFADEPIALQGTSVSVYPVVLDVRQRPANPEMATRIAEVIGLMLENAGMTDVQVAPTAWFPVDSDVAAGFSTHIRDASLPTETALYVRFGGIASLSEIDFTLCHREGTVVTEGSSSLPKGAPNDPMNACAYVVQALQARSDLGDPATPPETEGRMARTMRERSGLPPPPELEAAQARLEALQGSWTAPCAVYPVRVAGPDSADPAVATALVERLSGAGLGTPVAIESEMHLEVKGDPNQMKVLWDTARAFREYLRAHPSEQPYALLVEFGPIPAVHYVHVILCESDGDWVVVDMQNNHHADFKRIDPDSVEDCIDLAVVRLEQRMR